MNLHSLFALIVKGVIDRIFKMLILRPIYARFVLRDTKTFYFYLYLIILNKSPQFLGQKRCNHISVTV